MRKLLLLCLLFSGCGFTKTHVIIYEAQAAHIHAPVPISSISMKTTFVPVGKYYEQP